jgi:pyrroloquinoline quinone biosynthesis protein D
MTAAAQIPKLNPGVKLRNDPARGWMLMAPERFLLLDEPAYAIASKIDGTASAAQIAAGLAREFAADETDLRDDVLAFLDELSAGGYISQ